MAYHTQSRLSFPAGDAIAACLLVQLLNGELALCDAGDKPLGATEYPAKEAGDLINVRLLNAQGTLELTATGDVVAGGEVQLADGGVVKADTGAGARTIIGMALTGVTGGGIVEVVPYGYGHNLS